MSAVKVTTGVPIAPEGIVLSTNMRAAIAMDMIFLLVISWSRMRTEVLSADMTPVLSEDNFPCTWHSLPKYL
jgi:hypothetical protein